MQLSHKITGQNYNSRIFIAQSSIFINVYQAFRDIVCLYCKSYLPSVWFSVGEMPDMLHPTSDCSKVYVAIEAEPYADLTNERMVDNPGAVSIITFDTDPSGTYTLKRLGFEGFDDR